MSSVFRLLAQSVSDFMSTRLYSTRTSRLKGGCAIAGVVLSSTMSHRINLSGAQLGNL